LKSTYEIFSDVDKQV